MDGCISPTIGQLSIISYIIVTLLKYSLLTNGSSLILALILDAAGRACRLEVSNMKLCHASSGVCMRGNGSAESRSYL